MVYRDHSQSWVVYGIVFPTWVDHPAASSCIQFRVPSPSTAASTNFGGKGRAPCSANEPAPWGVAIFGHLTKRKTKGKTVYPDWLCLGARKSEDVHMGGSVEKGIPKMVGS